MRKAYVVFDKEYAYVLKVFSNKKEADKYLLMLDDSDLELQTFTLWGKQ